MHVSCVQVMASSGDLSVLRLCRYMRARVGPPYSYVLYGSHMAIGMAIGLLFMGGGQLVSTVYLIHIVIKLNMWHKTVAYLLVHYFRL